jgi:hypothetical protein
MFGITTLLLCALAATNVAAHPTYQYKFDAASAGGVEGTITVDYDSETSTKATIAADLDFSKVALSDITKADANCTAEVAEYKWHIHVKWPSAAKTSDAFGQCGLTHTGNHYDPAKACGPASEYSTAADCVPKIPTYTCNPTNYAANPEACEKGDLSGKLGGLVLDTTKKVKKQWVDSNYPLPSENTPEWNMVLHAACGKAPRVACAVGVVDAGAKTASKKTTKCKARL